MMTTVTFIPGMFSPIINTFLGTYFIDQMEYLNDKGIAYDVMPVNTEGTLDVNAEIIRNNVQNRKNVTAFCHSKGGIDLLHALIKYPELRANFKKIIFMQCPFFGTPLADFAMGHTAPKFAMKGIFKLFLKGDIKSILELTNETRNSYMKEHAVEILTILTFIEVECIGSSKTRESGRFDSILKIPRDFMNLKFKLDNDGMVPLESAFIPGAVRTVYPDLDHASAVIRMTPQFFDRKAFSHKVFAGVGA